MKKTIFFIIGFVVVVIFLAILFRDFLNNNSGAFNVIFSGLVASATIVYAILTWRLVSETKELREAQTEPYVLVYYQPREGWIDITDLVIHNVGSGPAHDIKFKVNPDFKVLGGDYFSQTNFIKNGVRLLAPKQKLQFFLTAFPEFVDEKLKKPFEITITYKNKIGKEYPSQTFPIDLSELEGLALSGKSPLHKIAEKIGELQKDFNLVNAKVKGTHFANGKWTHLQVKIKGM